MSSPSILVDGVTPPQTTVQNAVSGSKVNGTKNLGTASVALSLASLVGVSSVLWEVLEIPSGSAAVLSSSTSTTPTFGALDKPGRYILACTVNGNALERTIFAISVPTAAGLHIPGTAEIKEWDQTDGWSYDMQVGLQKGGVSGRATTTDATLTTIATLPIPDASVVKVIAKVVARRASNGDSAHYELRDAAKRHGGGAAALIGAVLSPSFAADAGAGAWAASLAVSGNNLLVKVQGAVGHTVTWSAALEVEATITT